MVKTMDENESNVSAAVYSELLKHEGEHAYHIGRATVQVSRAETRLGTIGGRKSILSMLTYRTSFCFWL